MPKLIFCFKNNTIVKKTQLCIGLFGVEFFGQDERFFSFYSYVVKYIQ
jgi:hypothetical protein